MLTVGSAGYHNGLFDAVRNALAGVLESAGMQMGISLRGYAAGMSQLRLYVIQSAPVADDEGGH